MTEILGNLGGGLVNAVQPMNFSIPGDPMNVPTTWEGYRLTRKGQSRYALGLAIMSSASAGSRARCFWPSSRRRSPSSR